MYHKNKHKIEYHIKFHVSFIHPNLIGTIYMRFNIVTAFTIALLTGVAASSNGQRIGLRQSSLSYIDSLVLKENRKTYVDTNWVHAPQYGWKYITVAESKKPIAFHFVDTVLKSPGARGCPVNSVIFADNLITLFKYGRFVCYTLPSLARNFALEEKLNTMKFRLCCVSGNTLVAVSGKQTYSLSADLHWEISKNIDLKRRPKLFEDERYSVTANCAGEFGGEACFYNKTTKETHYVEATCANTIFKDGDTYYILCNLDHGFPTSELHVIGNPESLPVDDTNAISDFNEEFTPFDAREHMLAAPPVVTDSFRFIGLETLTVFQYQDRMLYLVKHRGKKFLAEINGGDVSIVHALNDLPTNGCTTKQYGKRALIRVADISEKAILVIDNNNLICIHWNRRRHDKY